MLSYVYFCANDLNRAKAFYDAALEPLGMERCVTNDPECDRTSLDGDMRMAAGGAFGSAFLSTSDRRQSVVAAWSH
jgi:hypothetical protein